MKTTLLLSALAVSLGVTSSFAQAAWGPDYPYRRDTRNSDPSDRRNSVRRTTPTTRVASAPDAYTPRALGHTTDASARSRARSASRG
jgi:hypothetical protein